MDPWIDWLIENKDWEWVFSGIGVAIIGWLGAWFWWRLTKQRQLILDLAQRNRQRMLEKVHHFWIEGVLNQSLYHVAHIELGLVEEPEAIEHPWKLVAQQPGQTSRPLPDGMPMHAVFKQFDQTLLLLGAPGSGKTTLLLELARDLIERAKEDPEHPIPVVFNLSSWALRRPSLEAWLVDELSQRYDVPRKVGQAWIDHDQVLPLLDGLDEVALEHRAACVEVINAFHQAHGLLPLVVCSRVADYEALTVRLRLPGAVTIQPLTRPQVDAYLRRAGTALSGVSAALHQDETLWELLDTPLMLSILALAYQGQMTSEIRIGRLTGSLETRRAALFNAYIKAMFKRRDTEAPYTPVQTRHWLSWLAQAMVRFDQTVFYLEHMQWNWLSKAQARLQKISVRQAFGLLSGLTCVLAVELHVFVQKTAPDRGLDYGLLGVGWLYALLNQQIHPIEALRWSWKEAGSGLLDMLLNILDVRLLSGLLFLLLFLLLSVLTGVMVGYVDVEVVSRLFGRLSLFLFSGLLFLLLLLLLGGLVAGLVAGLIEDEIPARTISNEGIRRSLKNALGVGLSIWLFAGLLFALFLMLFFTLFFALPGVQPVNQAVGLFDGLSMGLSIGLLVGLLVGLYKGGFACIQHSVLRLLLWRYDYAPLRYIRFLDYAVDHLFLRRVGGGYIFVHRMLMEHFAGLKPQSEDAEAATADISD